MKTQKYNENTTNSATCRFSFDEFPNFPSGKVWLIPRRPTVDCLPTVGCHWIAISQRGFFIPGFSIEFLFNKKRHLLDAHEDKLVSQWWIVCFVPDGYANDRKLDYLSSWNMNLWIIIIIYYYYTEENLETIIYTFLFLFGISYLIRYLFLTFKKKFRTNWLL